MPIEKVLKTTSQLLFSVSTNQPFNLSTFQKPLSYLVFLAARKGNIWHQ